MILTPFIRNLDQELMHKLTIIILSYNTKELLSETLNLLKTPSQWQIVVVDNASTDDTLAMLSRDYPQVQVIKNDRNLGFAKANNQALKSFKSEYYLLLNSDAHITPESIVHLLEYAHKHPQVGMITPKILLPSGQLDPACHRGEPTPWRAFTYFAHLEQLFPKSKLFGGYHQFYLDLNSTHPLEATSATALLVRSKAIDSVGLLDEQFFFYAEDLDWCKRFRDQNWHIIYYPKVSVLHLKSASGKKNKKNRQTAKQARYFFWSTMLQYYQKHYANFYPKPITLVVTLGNKILQKISHR